MQVQLAAILFLLLTAAGLRAHPILQNPLWIAPAPDKLTLHLHVTVRELMVIGGLTVDTAGRADPLAAADAADRHTGYVLDHLHLKADGQPLTGGKVVRISPPDEHLTGEEGPDNTRFVFLIEYPLSGMPRQFSFRQTMCIEYPTAPGVPWDFSYATRYGAPPGGDVKLFFPMVSDKDYVVETGSAMMAGGTATGTDSAPRIVETPKQNHWFALWCVFGLLAVCGVKGSRPIWLQGALAAWMTGYVAASVSGIPLLPALASVLCGVAALLLGIDNIHASAGSSALRRGIVLTAGAFCFGWALFAQIPDWVPQARVWPIIALGAAAAVAALCHFPAAKTRRVETPAGRAFRQLLSLGGCAAAVWLMMVLLDVISATGSADGQ